MSSRFTKEKQLAFGSIIGGFLSAVQRENELSDNDLVALVLNVAAGQASIARWSLESFVAQAQRAYQQSAAVIRPDAPMPNDPRTRLIDRLPREWCSACRDYVVDGRCSCPGSSSR